MRVNMQIMNFRLSGGGLSMSDSEFQFHWPLIAGALAEQGDES